MMHICIQELGSDARHLLQPGFDIRLEGVDDSGVDDNGVRDDGGAGVDFSSRRQALYLAFNDQTR